MKTQPAFVWADGTVEFNTHAAVHLNPALVIGPGHTENKYPFRFHQPFENAVFFILRVPLQHRFQCFKDFFDGLVKFRFRRILFHNHFIYGGTVRHGGSPSAVIPGTQPHVIATVSRGMRFDLNRNLASDSVEVYRA